MDKEEIEHLQQRGLSAGFDYREKLLAEIALQLKELNEWMKKISAALDHIAK